MHIPKISNIDTALTIYYEYSEIGNKEIIELFGNLSSTTICKLKKVAKEKMAEGDLKTFGLYTVRTEAAFEAWGIDIESLEERRNKLIKLGLRQRTASS